MYCRLIVACVTSLAAALTSIGARAWGPEGHAIIADIAEAHLTPAARAQVAQLLALENHDHLDQVSSWADEVRSQRRETAPWHYVDIPLDAGGYDHARDCPGGNCVVAKLVDFEKVLADRSAAPQDRLEALKWVVHFVGDIHQPLHAEDHGDKGGNDVHLAYFGKETNLHAVWDSGIIEHALDMHLGPNYSFDHESVRLAARKLDMVSREEFDVRFKSDPATWPLDKVVIGWANDAHEDARTIAYADLPRDLSGDWSAAYQEKVWPVVQFQLGMAGVRLAMVLNGALR